MSAPTPDEIAELLQVEYLLDQRWPETKIEPSTVRIEALLEMLGSPQRGYPSIHVAGTNGKTSVTRMIDALLTAFSRRTGRTTSPHLQAATERIAIDGKPISPAQYVATYTEIEPFVAIVDRQSQAGELGEAAGEASLSVLLPEDPSEMLSRRAGEVVEVAEGFATVKLPDGSAVRGITPAPVIRGQKASIMIRPERLRLAGPELGAAAGYQMISGMVTDQCYLGESLQYEVEMPWKQNILARAPQTGPAGEIGLEMRLWLRDVDATVFAA